MQKSNSTFLKNQLNKFLTEVGVENFSLKDFDKIEYVVEFDPTEKQESKTNSDDIMRLWSLPNIIGKKLNINDVCEWLVTYKNEIPLWIRIESTSEENVLKLLISKRFRKIKIVEEWHKSNEYKPIRNEKTPHNNVYN
ncbi:hypothetical protein BA195_13860 [Tenacibaculum soleae]|uniref:Uncharacterized protein n=1 Tax=Tenacibaculum soleae TaxID=447689 RepID=A0A1B9XYU7_9FLAO|nr:hypothetical protein [Tenacibaculum soleae]OCK42689.1 hypothetical protein BA195_13860 [Tenacibaculum soleae]